LLSSVLGIEPDKRLAVEEDSAVSVWLGCCWMSTLSMWLKLDSNQHHSDRHSTCARCRNCAKPQPSCSAWFVLHRLLDLHHSG
ncbi:hypothetical protein T10_1204, partial [Trichinella papuae]